MKKSKIAIITIVAVISTVAGGVAFAKGPGKCKGENSEQRIEKRLERMTQSLELTEDQQTKVRAILEAKQASMKDQRQDESLSREEKRERHRAAKRETRQEVNTVLTAEQQAKAKTLHGERKGKKMAKRLERMTEHLDLTEAQQATSKGIMDDAKSERDLILEANGGDRKAAREELKAHRKAVKVKLRAVLTPEQATKFDSIKRDRKRGRRGGPDSQDNKF